MSLLSPWHHSGVSPNPMLPYWCLPMLPYSCPSYPHGTIVVSPLSPWHDTHISPLPMVPYSHLPSPHGAILTPLLSPAVPHGCLPIPPHPADLGLPCPTLPPHPHRCFPVRNWDRFVLPTQARLSAGTHAFPNPLFPMQSRRREWFLPRIPWDCPSEVGTGRPHRGCSAFPFHPRAA